MCSPDDVSSRCMGMNYVSLGPSYKGVKNLQRRYTISFNRSRFFVSSPGTSTFYRPVVCSLPGHPTDDANFRSSVILPRWFARRQLTVEGGAPLSFQRTPCVLEQVRHQQDDNEDDPSRCDQQRWSGDLRPLIWKYPEQSNFVETCISSALYNLFHRCLRSVRKHWTLKNLTLAVGLCVFCPCNGDRSGNYNSYLLLFITGAL